MRFSPLRVFAFLMLAGMPALQAGETTQPPATTTWTFNTIDAVGGVPWEPLGSPRIVPLSEGAHENTSAAIQFNGKSDGLFLQQIPIAGWDRFTIEILFRPDAGGLPEQRFLHLQDDQGRRLLIELRILPGDQWCLDTFLYSDSGHRLTLIDRTKAHALGRWHWAALRFADGRMTHFVNGIKECEGEVQFPPMSTTGRTSLGVRQNKVSWFKGAIREIRFTADALPVSKLQRLE